jgi:Ca-activated chloride channel family protein
MAARQFVSGVNVVEVYASVTNSRGEPVQGLTQADFDVREDGEPQRVSSFTSGDFPLSVAIALDRSFSMAGNRLALVKDGTRTFLGELGPQDESMIVSIGSAVEIVAPLSTDRRVQLHALERVDAFGTTGLHDAIVKSIDAVQPAKGRRALILLSDGTDRYSQTAVGDVLARARESDVMMYPVAVGANRPALFAELATLTGGRSFHVKDPALLTTTLRQIAAELHRQYLLGYTPSRPIVADSREWRSISVSVRRPGLQVRARDGYVAK